MARYLSARGPRPDQPTLDAFLDIARRQPRPLPLVGHVRHDSQRPGAVYIGRRNGGLPESPYANPFKMPRDGDRAAVIAQFERHARARLAADPHWLDGIKQAMCLLCWCRRVGEDRPACHGDSLIALMKETYSDNDH